MTTPGTVRSGVGFRNVVVYALNADGYIDATSPTTPYEGVEISGAKVLELNDPEPRQIVHMGDDRVFALDALPPDTPITGSLTTAKKDDVVEAVISQENSFTVGEMAMFASGTDQRGDEPQVAIVAYRQSLETGPASTNYGARRWESRWLPKVLCIKLESGFSDAPEEVRYSIYPQFIKKHLWGATLSESTEGANSAQVLRAVSQYKPKFIAWKADGTATTFTFPTASPAVETGKIAVWVNGTLQTVAMTAGTATIVFTTAPAANANVSVKYEVAA